MTATANGLRKAVELLPDDAEVHVLLGTVLEQTGDWHAALGQFRQAAKADPNFADAYANLGIGLRQQGDLPGALSALQNAAELAPANADVHYQLGFTLRRMGRLPEAETELQRSLSLQPNNAEAYYVLGQTLEQTGKHSESATAFAEVERLHRSSADYAQAVTQYNLGVQELGKGNLSAAREAFGLALSLRPNFAEAHTNLCGVLLRAGEVKSSIGQCRAAIDLKPDDARPYYNLGLALQKDGDALSAKEAFQHARELNPYLEGSERPSVP